MLRFKNLSSGSTGNATLVEASSADVSGSRGTSTTRLLVDCGLGLQRLMASLNAAGVMAADIDAIFITHEHGDHLGCVTQFASRHNIPVWASSGTHAALRDMRQKQTKQAQLAPDFDALVRIAQDTCAVDLGNLQFTPFTVPHDAREPLQLSCTDGASKLGILTDLGHASRHVLEQLAQCHALLLECNHDTDMLENSSYPAFLKARVGGDFGHLSNAAAAGILASLHHPGLRQVAAAHLSQQNNRPELAQRCLATALGCSLSDILIATAEQGTPWLSV